jgi:hypothetical protein
MTIVDDMRTPPCAHDPAFYHDEQLHEPPSRADLSTAEWKRLADKRAVAHRSCAGCPQMVACLYRAVVDVDVSGFVACTTEHDRDLIRRQLGIEVEQASSTTPYGAPRLGGGPVSHEAVMTMRQTHPQDTCHQLADRLGCSTSTIKRHLRRAREAQREEALETPASRAQRPSVDDVLDCFDRLATSQFA